MISINASFSNTVVKMTDRSVVATCPLGLSNQGTGLPVGISAVRPASLSHAFLSLDERNERPTKAPEAAVAAAQAQAYAFAAAGAGLRKQTTTQHHMWAFRGLEPWSDPA
ncbi:hypothetical protein [Streptomyces cavernicola]|uniref:Uncharacterized protein n=1 Tax=Streptomyces cavernicola TaxID=3043613 RepID=A0ABT6SID0_9ACTN|nr:hypothetical protein [Streptomyces sp. B-S-A6]MDI3407730.1 hypothetical protein [Streptomyces sp. B-S-A6]